MSLLVKNIEEQISAPLERAGIYYRIFSRIKSEQSTGRKISSKLADYQNKGKKMQDIVGVRLVLYFRDDIDYISSYFQRQSYYVDKSDSLDDLEKLKDLLQEANIEEISKVLPDLKKTVFMPVRLNLICRMNDVQTRDLKATPIFNKYPNLIDNTFELQIRTVLSEGWHEVEHDMRYKCKDESWWKGCDTESRALNGILASLESSEVAMQQLFSSMAHKNYLNKDWSAMIRNQFCIRLQDYIISDDIKAILNNSNNGTARCIHRIKREKFLGALLTSKTSFPLKMDNAIYLLNRLSSSPNQKLVEIEPDIIKDKLDKILFNQ